MRATSRARSATFRWPYKSMVVAIDAWPIARLRVSMWPARLEPPGRKRVPGRVGVLVCDDRGFKGPLPPSVECPLADRLRAFNRPGALVPSERVPEAVVRAESLDEEQVGKEHGAVVKSRLEPPLSGSRRKTLS
jgi:hypothetical protein